MPAIAGLRGLPHPTRMKLAATALLSLPAVLLIALALGEIAGGEMSGAQHLPEGGALLLVAVAGWRYPRAVGAFVLAAGVAILMAWVGFVVTGDDVGGRAPLLVWVGVGLVLFAPPIVAGWLLWRAGGRAGTLRLR